MSVPSIPTLRPGPLAPEQAVTYAEAVRQYLLSEAERQVGGSQFMVALRQGRLSRRALQRFWLDWHSQVWEVNNLIAVAYHRFTPFLRRHPELLAPFAAKVADELVHPEPPGHLLVVWAQGEALGLRREQLLHHPVSPECRALMEWHRGLLYEGTWIEYWSAMLYEEYTGHWSHAFGTALREHYGLGRDEIQYFTVHTEADLSEHEGVMGHGAFNWLVFCRLLEDGETQCRPGFSIPYCIDTELALRRRFLDACAAE
jgi:pyrroloquinoline quinone (PQQ) biosynthesis protein C